jgi:hypothetical protein
MAIITSPPSGKNQLRAAGSFPFHEQAPQDLARGRFRGDPVPRPLRPGRRPALPGGRHGGAAGVGAAPGLALRYSAWRGASSGSWMVAGAALGPCRSGLPATCSAATTRPSPPYWRCRSPPPPPCCWPSRRPSSARPWRRPSGGDDCMAGTPHAPSPAREVVALRRYRRWSAAGCRNPPAHGSHRWDRSAHFNCIARWTCCRRTPPHTSGCSRRIGRR